jgi:hypothetical protein
MKNCPANRKQGEPQGFLAIISLQLSGVLGEISSKSNPCMFIRTKNQTKNLKILAGRRGGGEKIVDGYY